MIETIIAASETMTVVYGLVVFLGIIVGLIAIIQFAGSKLKPQGNVKLTINGEAPLEVAQGDTLLGTLMGQKILLPSACGGGGTCAMCRCHVLSGGGDVLPTEKVTFHLKISATTFVLLVR